MSLIEDLIQSMNKVSKESIQELGEAMRGYDPPTHIQFTEEEVRSMCETFRNAYDAGKRLGELMMERS